MNTYVTNEGHWIGAGYDDIITETEARQIAAQNYSISNKSNQNLIIIRRIGSVSGNRDETINLKISECSKLARKKPEQER